jgi:predicted GNAT family acetyltransferase
VKLKIYDEAGAFLERVRLILEQNEAANSLMLGLLSMAAETPGVFGGLPYMGLFEDAGETLLIALKTPNAKLVLYADTGPTVPDECFDLLAADLAAKSLKVPGVLGPPALTARFAPRWVSHKGGSYRLWLREGIYELTEVVPPRPVAGSFRPAHPEDAELLARWLMAFQEEALGLSATFEEVIGQVHQRIEAGNLFVWQDQTGRVVTLAARSRPTRHGATVNAVYTPPELRGKGYASNCVAALSQLILDSGKRFAALFTDLSNPTSNHIYQKIGYKHLLDYDEIVFEP